MLKYILALLLFLPAQVWGGVFVGFGQSSTATITYQSSTTCSATTNSVVCDIPTSTADGDLLVAAVNTDTNGTLNTPSGWTLVQSATFSSDTLALYYKVASGEGGTITFTSDNWGDELAAIVSRYTKSGGTWSVTDSGVDSGAAKASLSVSDVSATTPGILVAAWGSDDSPTVTTAPANMDSTASVTLTASSLQTWRQAVTTGDYSKSLVLSSGDNGFILATFTAQ